MALKISTSRKKQWKAAFLSLKHASKKHSATLSKKSKKQHNKKPWNYCSKCKFPMKFVKCQCKIKQCLERKTTIQINNYRVQPTHQTIDRCTSRIAGLWPQVSATPCLSIAE